MRLLHTSDWHLGKRLFKLDRAQEHGLFLEWLIEIIKQKEIDILLIAGDVFDTPTPPHQALETFYNFLHRVSTETKTQTLIIAGNHDSGLLLEAPSKILAPHRVKVWGKLSEKQEDHWIRIGNIDICAIPFFRSFELLPQGEGDALLALKSYLSRQREGMQLLMLHHLAGIYEAAGSEQVITLSGVDSIPSEILKTFDYVALGHIHKPQKIAPNSYSQDLQYLFVFLKHFESLWSLLTKEREDSFLPIHQFLYFENFSPLKPPRLITERISEHSAATLSSLPWLKCKLNS
jgi:exonuclease SbcD